MALGPMQHACIGPTSLAPTQGHWTAMAVAQLKGDLCPLPLRIRIWLSASPTCLPKPVCPHALPLPCPPQPPSLPASCGQPYLGQDVAQGCQHTSVHWPSQRAFQSVCNPPGPAHGTGTDAPGLDGALQHGKQHHWHEWGSEPSEFV